MLKKVALFTRAWIEMTTPSANRACVTVALFTRAWIEIAEGVYLNDNTAVALFTRAWIEISFQAQKFTSCICRPLYEGVD